MLEKKSYIVKCNLDLACVLIFYKFLSCNLIENLMVESVEMFLRYPYI